MIYRPIIHEFSAFQFKGDLTDNKGRWCVPDWAVYLYQEGKFYFQVTTSLLPSTDLYYKKDENSISIHIKVDDYVIKLHDGIHIIDKETFEAMFKEI